MAWERRARGGLYYTRSRWEDGRVVREYIGRGEAAAAVAQLDAHVRAMRQWTAARMRDEQTRLEALDKRLDEYYRRADAQMKSELIALGFHQHGGEWRRKRGERGGDRVTNSKASSASRAKYNDANAHATDWHAADEFERQQLLDAAQHGDRRAAETVLAGAEADAALYDQLTNTARREREALITTTCGAANALTRASLLKRAQHLEDELVAECACPSALERMLIERVATSWLAAHLTDLEAEARMQSATPLALPWVHLHEQRRENAHRRYLSAAQTLARARRLLRPRRRGAQINIAALGAQQLKRHRDGD